MSAYTPAVDRHGRLSPEALREAGCICDLGCPTCGMAYEAMGKCPAWDPCPVGRNPNESCPLSEQRGVQEAV